MPESAPRRRERVLFVDHTPVIGGAELVLATHIEALDRSRFEPLVACTDTVPLLIDRYREAGAEVHVLAMPQLRRLSLSVPFDLLRAAWRLRELIRAQRVSLVVANTSRAAYIASVALVATGIPLIWWVRDFLFGRAAFRALAWRAKRFICVSQSIRAFYDGGADPRFAVVYVGSSLGEALGSLSADAVRAERARWGFSDDDVVVGFMGRLVDDKGSEDVLDAVIEAHGADSRIKLLIVGSGRGQEGDVEGVLHRTVRERALPFVALAGFQRDEALYYRLFDLFVLATRTPEPYATSVVQAMLAERPVIATATGGTPELVHHELTGLLVPPRSPSAMAAAILRLVREPTLRRQMTDRALRVVQANNREDVVTAQVEAIYDRVLSTRAV